MLDAVALQDKMQSIGGADFVNRYIVALPRDVALQSHQMVRRKLGLRTEVGVHQLD